MHIKVKFEGVGDLVVLSQFFGAAPCQVLALNQAKNEHELVGREILVPVSTPAMIRTIDWYYVTDQSKILVRRTRT